MDSCKDEAGRRRDGKSYIMIHRASSPYAVAVAPVMRSVAVLLLHCATLICAHCLEDWNWVSILHHIRDHPVGNVVNGPKSDGQ